MELYTTMFIFNVSEFFEESLLISQDQNQLI